MAEMVAPVVYVDHPKLRRPTLYCCNVIAIYPAHKLEAGPLLD